MMDVSTAFAHLAAKIAIWEEFRTKKQTYRQTSAK
jgi:hypothetical protein